MFKTKMQKTWLIFVASALAVVAAVAFIGIFLDKELSSNILFGLGVITLLPLVYIYFSSKSKKIGNYKKGVRYQSNQYLNRDIANKEEAHKIEKLRVIMVALFSIIVFTICISMALIFALV